MPEHLLHSIADYFIKPATWYQYSQLRIAGYRIIATKEEQRQAGALQEVARSAVRMRQFGPNPVKPYRDYYGTLRLQTRLLSEELEVKFAIGYTLNSQIVTGDDYSNFSWLRLCTGLDQILYPNLSQQKQLLDYLRAHSRKPQFLITRVYQVFQFELYQSLVKEIVQRDSGQAIRNQE